MTSTRLAPKTSIRGHGSKPRPRPVIQAEGAQSAGASKPAPRKAQVPKLPAPASAKHAPRPNSKAAKILGLLRRPDGITISALIKATEWQAHSVRGFLSGTVSKRMGLKLTSTRSDAGERVYSVNA